MRNAIVRLSPVTTLDEDEEITLAQLCRACAVQVETIQAMVEEGILEPVGGEMDRWRFPGPTIRRVRIVVRLQRELSVNLPGAALALQLLERIDELEARVRTSR